MILSRALRRLVRGLSGLMRSARRAFCVMPVLLVPSVGLASEDWQDQPLVAARYADPTTRYAHAVLGDAIEHGTLVLHYGPNQIRHIISLPAERVFEDTTPRLADIDGDGQDEAIVVESHRDQGARLAVYNGAGLMAATPYIGQRFRWLAPVGAADLDGDGRVELAYIDRPHLAKTLRIWRFEGGTLRELAQQGGLTNHRIGERDIAGGIRDCGAGPEMIVASGDWLDLRAARFDGTEITVTTIGKQTRRSDFAAAMAC